MNVHLQSILSVTISSTHSTRLLRAILWAAVWFSSVNGACDQVHELTASNQHNSQPHSSSTTNVITIDSPNYPYTQYPPRSSCRYSIRAPLGYAITVQCNMNLPARSGGGGKGAATDTPPPFANSHNCQTDFLYISAPASEEANDGYFEYFCGRGYVSRTSVFNTLTLAYESRSDTEAGYFSCTAFATRQSCDCGWNPATRHPGGGVGNSRSGSFGSTDDNQGGSGRIIKGQEALANEYAAMVALVDRQTGRVFCGGSIIHQRYVLTAAHCVLIAADSDQQQQQPQKQHRPADGSEFYILAGDHDITTGADTKYSQLYYVEEVRRHERFDRSGFDNDIALLRTTADIIWSRAVGPACLPFRFFGNTFENQIVEIAGWGTTEFGGPSSNQPARLQKTTVTTLSNAACKSTQPTVPDDILCTYSAVGHDACQMDSGGGLMWRNHRSPEVGPGDGRLYLVGVISYGLQCGRNTPGFNTRVTNYLNWIIANSRGANFCIP